MSAGGMAERRNKCRGGHSEKMLSPVRQGRAKENLMCVTQQRGGPDATALHLAHRAHPGGAAQLPLPGPLTGSESISPTRPQGGTDMASPPPAFLQCSIPPAARMSTPRQEKKKTVQTCKAVTE